MWSFVDFALYLVLLEGLHEGDLNGRESTGLMGKEIMDTPFYLEKIISGYHLGKEGGE
jgi:hypothetical protein